MECFLLGASISLFSCTEGSDQIAESIVEHAMIIVEPDLDTNNKTFH